MKKRTLKTIFCLILFSVQSNIFGQCQASFTYTNNGSTFNFVNTSNGGLGTIIQNLWNFGDGATSTQLNDSHTYTSCGTYTVSLTIFTSSFCTSTYTDSIQVNIPINGSFMATVDTTNGNTNFVAQPVNINYNYSWTFGDGGSGTGAATVHTYNNGGNYNACLTINDNSGLCSDTFCNNVLVYIANPSCAISFTSQALGGTLAFTPSPFNLTDTYIWNYGDGSPKDTSLIGNHTYAASGNYVVCLTVITLQGCSNTYCQNVSVSLTSITENEKLEISLYPNPVSEDLFIKTNFQKEDLQFFLMDVSGRKLRVDDISQAGETLVLKTKNIESGLYFLEIRYKGKTKLVKFFKD